MTFKEYIKYNPINISQIRIELSNRGLTDIYGIEKYTQLKWLKLDSNNISDITPLSKLLHLRFLRINSNDITDISCLKNLNIEVLGIGYNKIQNIDIILSLKNLYDVYLYGNNLSDDFKDFLICDNRIVEIENLKKCININRRKRIINDMIINPNTHILSSLL